MYVAFCALGRRRLNMVFDAIGFIYPDYCFPARKRGSKRKSAPKASSVVLKPKREKNSNPLVEVVLLERAAQLPDTGA
jgi:hypothetical protein